jgi:type II secretory pathway component GspD/PulD (secretin)
MPPPPAPPPAPGEPLYSLEIHHQEAESVIWAFASEAHITVTLLDRPSARISLRFTNFTLEKALRAILAAADMEFVKTEDGYIVGLAVDLKLRFPHPDDKIIDAVYRCRRIDATTLAESLEKSFTDVADFKVSPGPEYLTPVVEDASPVGSEEIHDHNLLTATEEKHRIHDIVISGPPDVVRRALSLARKFDRPRKQVRVNIRVVRMTTSASRNLGVAWMPSLSLSANEVPNPGFTASDNPSGNESAQGTGLTLGKFTHSVVSVNATLNALEQSGQAKTLANPTLMVLDGERSYILSGTKYILPEIKLKEPGGQAEYDTVEVKLGLYMQVAVQVGLDDDMTLTIYPQVSTLNGFNTINTIDYPIINTVEEQATVRAVKGDVIVLGGLKQEVSSDSKSGIPFLSTLPLIGKLFSNTNKAKNTEELMFVLTPEIIDETELALDMTLSVAPAPDHPVS